MILALHHIQIVMPKGGEAEARHFYGSILGLPEVEKPEPLRARGGVWFETQNVGLHIGVEEPFIAARKAHPAFQVGSLAETIQRMEAHEVPYRRDIDLPGIQRIYISDPFGNRIELLELVA